MNFFWSKSSPLNATFSAPLPFPHNRMNALPAPQRIRLRNRRDLPDKKGWALLVHKALEQIEKGHLEKVVLARCTICECTTPPDPFALAASLDPTGAALFCFSNETQAFFGATPELLFSRSRNQITTVAMAGTRKRGKTPHADQKLERELLSSSKDLREWSFIPRHFQTTLSPLCTAPLTFSPLRIHKTHTVQHLYSVVRATLKSPLPDSTLLQQLHPTPALSGTPRDAALAFIREFEPFERSPYGEVIGWSTPDAAEYYVAIRSCLLQGTTLCFYAGTGIVAGSHPDAEWEELEQKLQLFKGFFS